MQWFVVVMAILVIAGTIFDVVHKRSAQYFFQNMRKSKDKAKIKVGGGQKVGIAAKTVLVDVATSGEFCSQKRRISHLLTMWGFIFYVLATAAMVFFYAGSSATPALWTFLWWAGALMLAIGTIWFWFFIRVDVAAEGHSPSPFRLVRADMFVVSLMLSAVFGLLWALTQHWVLLGLYLIATVVLFAGVPWSKFAHMFFKPAAAFEKRMSKANGTVQNLPTTTRDDPEQRKRHSMELLQDAPMDMGLGIKREAPRHY